MIEKSAIEVLLEMAKTNETLRRNIGNLMMFGYWESKYYNFEDMIKDEFPELLRLYTPWEYDMHCMGVFRAAANKAQLAGLPGKVDMFKTLINAHKDSIKATAEAIRDHIYENDMEGMFE